MAAFRLALILLLSVAVDLAVPPLLEAMDGGREFEELFHRFPARRSPRMIRDAAPPPPPLRVHAVSAPVVERAPRVWSAGTPPDAHARKTPPPDAESTPASDDH